jgi:hypothetical protein
LLKGAGTRASNLTYAQARHSRLIFMVLSLQEHQSTM